MNKERDLLPWVFGGLAAAAIAVAFAAVSTHRDVPISAARAGAAPAPAAATSVPAAAIAPADSPPAQSNAAPVPPAALARATVEPQIPTGQIYQCITQGVKTFSNNPCGEKSTLLEVGPINTMNATPVTHYSGSYQAPPRYAAGYPDQSAQPDTEEYPNPYSTDSGENSYAIVGLARRRPERMHRPDSPLHHHRSPAPLRRD